MFVDIASLIFEPNCNRIHDDETNTAVPTCSYDKPTY